MSISLRSRKGYIICSNPRSGSNLLTDTLRQTRVAGDPREYFNSGVQRSPEFNRLIGAEPDEIDTNPSTWFGRVLNQGTTDNGMFAAKVHGIDVSRMVSAIRRAEIEGSETLGENPGSREVAALWGSLEIVRLRRTNIVAQAISHYRAIATNVWYLPKNGSRPDGRDRTPPYDYEALRELVRFQEDGELIWDAFLRDFPRPILSMTYEDLSLDPAAWTEQVLAHLGLYSRAAERVKVQLTRQADELSLEWEERFIAERRDRREAPLEVDASASVSSGPRSLAAVAAPRRRVCLVSKEVPGLFRNGGIGTAMGGLAQALARSRFDVTLLFVSTDAGDKDAADAFRREQERYAGLGVTLKSVAAFPGTGHDPRRLSYSVYQYLSEQEFDCLVFAENSGLGFYSIEAKRTGSWANPPRIIVVAHGPGQWVRQLNGTSLSGPSGLAADFLERRSVELADVLVSPSQYLVDWMAGSEWPMATDSRVIQNIIPDSPRDRTSGLAPGQVKEIVFFGRQETRKGLALFCDAIDLLNDGALPRDIRVTILGKFDDVDGAHSGIFLANRMRPWRVVPRVISTFGQAEAIDYLSRPGVLAVMPSLAENSPCVVTECIASGIAFLATSSGGTAELVDPADRDSCLFAPDDSALANKIAEVLARGQAAIRPAIAEAETLAAWTALLNAQPAVAAPGTEPLPSMLSICLVGSPTGARATLESIGRQTALTAEIVLVDTSEQAVDRLGMEGEYPLRVLGRPGASLAEGRNAAAQSARGDALLFADLRDAWPDTNSVADYWRAHRSAGTDITTSLTTMQSGETLTSMPVGGCAPLSALENCVGETPFIVSTTWFREHGGFCAAEDGVIDWIYLAQAIQAGATCSVLPRAVATSPRASREPPSQRAVSLARKAIAQSLGASPAGRLADTLEYLLVTRPSPTDAVATSQPEVRGLSGRRPNGPEAERAFVEYCFLQGLVDLAVDYAVVNGIESLGSVMDAAGKTMSRTALRWIAPGHVSLSHQVDLTDALRAAIGGTPESRVILEQSADASAGIIRIHNGCPPGLLGVRARAELQAPAAGRQRYAIAVARSGAPVPLLGEETRGRDWSGWVSCSDDTMLVAGLALPAAHEMPLDLVLLAEPANGDSSEGLALSWVSVTADLEGVGTSSVSAFDRQFRHRPVSSDALLNAQLLSDVSSFPHQVLTPGVPLLTHPIPGASILVRLSSLLPRGARGLKCKVSLDHAQARAVDVNLYLVPTAKALPYPAGPRDLIGVIASSGWMTLAQAPVQREMLVLLDRPADEGLDGYLSVRPADGMDVDFSLATWREFVTLE